MNKIATEAQTDRITDTKSQKVLRESFFLLYIALTLTYTGLVSYFLGSAIIIFYDLKNGSANALALDVIDVWKTKKIITDLTLTSTGRCPSGYSLAYEYIWPGIKELCNCPEETSEGDISYTVHTGICSASFLSQNCISSAAFNEQNLNKWRNSKRLCLKYGEDTFFTLRANCDPDSGYKSCGDSDTAYCAKTSDGCPISSVFVGSGLGVNDYSVLSLDSSNSLYFGKVSSNFPIAVIKVTTNYFCAFHDRDFSPNQALFLYSKSNDRFDCPIIDQEYQIIDQMGLLDFYDINALSSTLNSLVSYPRVSNEYSVILGSRTFQYWSYKCRTSSDYSLSKTEEFFNLSSHQTFQIGLIIVTVISLLVSGLVLPGIDIAKRYFLGPEHRADAKVLKTGTLLIDKFFRFAIFPLIIVCFTKVKNDLAWLNAIIDYKCSTDFFDTAINQPHFDSLNSLSGFYGNILAIWVLMVILDIIYMTVRYMTDRKKELVRRKKQSLVLEEKEPLKENKIFPKEEGTPPRNEKTDLEDNLVDVADIHKVTQEIQKAIKEANEPTKAQIKGLEIEMQGTLKEIKDPDIELNTRNQINSKDFLLAEEEKKQEDMKIPKSNKFLPPLKAKSRPTLEGEQFNLPSIIKSKKDFL